MPKHIGIVACSAEGAALCYRTICVEAPDRMGRHNHPEVSMHTIPLAEYMLGIESGNWNAVAELMLRSAEKLAEIGADFCVCPDNTIHQAFGKVVEKSSLPWLHIAEEVAGVARSKGYRKLGILGTKFLMEGPVYPEKLEKVGIAHAIPGEADREAINTVIFDDLVYGRLRSAARSRFVKIIAALAWQGCDAVVLGCTEIPLLFDNQSSPIPTLDSTRLLARAAIGRALQA